MPAAVTDHLELLLAELHTNQALRAEFATNPANAIAPFNLTSHERHAVLKRDCDDLLVLEVAASNGDLPDLLGCPGSGGGGPLDLSDLLDSVRDRLAGLLDRVPGLDRPIPPKPQPEPGPSPPGPRPRPTPRPGPRPGPTPGPDPPGPDIRRPSRDIRRPSRGGGADPSPPGE